MFSCGYGLVFMNTFQVNNTWIEKGVWSKCIIMSLSHSVHWRAPTTIKLASVWTFILDKLAHVLWAVAKPKNYLPCMSERASAIHKLFTHLPRNHGDTSIIDVPYVYFYSKLSNWMECLNQNSGSPCWVLRKILTSESSRKILGWL